MSDTPRTDLVNGYVRCVWTEHSAQLERELNEANQRIKRLEVAGDELELATAAGTNDALRAAKSNWRKAKEAKP